MAVEILTFNFDLPSVVIDNAGNTGPYTIDVFFKDTLVSEFLGLNPYPDPLTRQDYIPDGDTVVTLIAKDSSFTTTLLNNDQLTNSFGQKIANDNAFFTPILINNDTFTKNLATKKAFNTALASATDFFTTLNATSAYHNAVTATYFGGSNNSTRTMSQWTSAFATRGMFIPVRGIAVPTVFNSTVGSGLNIKANPTIIDLQNSRDINTFISNIVSLAFTPRRVEDETTDIPADMWTNPFTAPTLFSFNETINSSINLHNYFFNNSSFIHNLSSGNIKADSLTGVSISSTSLSSDLGVITQLTATQITATQIIAVSGFFDNLSSTNLFSDKNVLTFVSAQDISATTGIILNLSTINLSAENITTTKISAQNIAVDLISGTSAIFINFSSNNISATDIISNNVTSTNITAHNILVDLISGVSANFIDLSSINASLSSITSANIFTDFLSAKNLDISASLNISGTLSAQNISATDIISTSITALNISSANLTTIALSAQTLTADDLHVNKNLTVGNLITAFGNSGHIHATRFIGEVIGPSVTIGNTADLLRLSAQKAVIDSLTSAEVFITNANITAANILSLTCQNILTDKLTATEILTNSITGTSGVFLTLSAQTFNIDGLNADNLSAEEIHVKFAGITSSNITNLTGTNAQLDNLLIIGDSSIPRLTVIQKSLADVAKFYFNDSCNVGETSSIALVIKGNGCHTDSPDQYTGGFVGIRTENPTEALTVRGNITADNILTDGLLKGGLVEGAAGIFETVTVTDTINLNDINTTGTIRASEIITIGDINVGGTLFGKISTSELSADSLNVNTLKSNFISAKFIETETGNSDLWNSSFFTPVAINLVLNGGESSIKHGAKGYVEIPFNIQITSWSMYADAPSPASAIMYILSSSFESYPDTIPIYNIPPAIEPGDIKNTSSTLNGWITQLSAGTVIHFGLSSNNIPGGFVDLDAKLLTLTIKGTKF